MKPSSVAGSLCQANKNWKEKIPPAFGDVERCPLPPPCCAFHPVFSTSIFILILHLRFHPPSPSPSHPPSPCYILTLQPSSLSSTPTLPSSSPLSCSNLQPHPPSSIPISIPFHHPLLCAAHTPSSPVLSPTRDHDAAKQRTSHSQTLPHSGHQSCSMPQFPYPQRQPPHLSIVAPALPSGSHQGVQSAHSRNNNPIPKELSALLRAANCPLFEDDQWKASSRPRTSTHHSTKSHNTAAFPKYLASITRRKSFGFLPLIGPTFPGAASQQPECQKP